MFTDITKSYGFSDLFTEVINTFNRLINNLFVKKKGRKKGGDAHIAPPSAMTDHPQRADVGIGPYGKCWMMGVGTPLRGVRIFPHLLHYGRTDRGGHWGQREAWKASPTDAVIIRSSL